MGELVKTIKDKFSLKKSVGINVLMKNGKQCLCPHAPLMPVQSGLTGGSGISFTQMPCNDTCPKFRIAEKKNIETGEVIEIGVVLCDGSYNPIFLMSEIQNC